jgi:hypothetical protein
MRYDNELRGSPNARTDDLALAGGQNGTDHAPVPRPDDVGRPPSEIDREAHAWTRLAQQPSKRDGGTCHVTRWYFFAGGTHVDQLTNAFGRIRDERRPGCCRLKEDLGKSLRGAEQHDGGSGRDERMGIRDEPNELRIRLKTQPLQQAGELAGQRTFSGHDEEGMGPAVHRDELLQEWREMQHVFPTLQAAEVQDEWSVGR